MKKRWPLFAEVAQISKLSSHQCISTKKRSCHGSNASYARGGQRSSARLKRVACEFFTLQATMRPSGGIQLVLGNFEQVGILWCLSVMDSSFDIPAVQKLREWVQRLVPLDGVAGALLGRLFSDESLCIEGQHFQCLRGSTTTCFPRLGQAKREFANLRGDDYLLRYRVPPSWGMRITGHRSIETCMRYASRPSPRDLRLATSEVFAQIRLEE